MNESSDREPDAMVPTGFPPVAGPDLSRSGRGGSLSRDWPAPVPDAPPITYTVKGQGNLPDGQFLIDVYPDGVTLAWRPDCYHGTLWMPPSEGVRSE